MNVRISFTIYIIINCCLESPQRNWPVHCRYRRLAAMDSSLYDDRIRCFDVCRTLRCRGLFGSRHVYVSNSRYNRDQPLSICIPLSGLRSLLVELYWKQSMSAMRSVLRGEDDKINKIIMHQFAAVAMGLRVV